MTPPFNPQLITVQYTLTIPQVNIILEGLGKLPFDKVEVLYADLRRAALQALQIAEAASKTTPTVIEPGALPTDEQLQQASTSGN